MALELVLGAVGAAASLGAGLIKTLTHRKTGHADLITLTVEHGGRVIKKQGVVSSEKVEDILAMVHEDSPQ